MLPRCLCGKVHGADGAAELARRLSARGVTELEFISDEGLPVTDGLNPSVSGPVARSAEFDSFLTSMYPFKFERSKA